MIQVAHMKIHNCLPNELIVGPGSFGAGGDAVATRAHRRAVLTEHAQEYNSSVLL